MSDTAKQRLDPFQEYCLRTVGRDMALGYKELQKLTGFEAGTLYNARNNGEIIPVDPTVKRPVYHWPTVKQYMQDKGRWSPH